MKEALGFSHSVYKSWSRSFLLAGEGQNLGDLNSVHPVGAVLGALFFFVSGFSRAREYMVHGVCLKKAGIGADAPFAGKHDHFYFVAVLFDNCWVSTVSAGLTTSAVLHKKTPCERAPPPPSVFSSHARC